MRTTVLKHVAVYYGVAQWSRIALCCAVAFGYTDPVSVTTIGADAATYIVGPVTGTALGATSKLPSFSPNILHS